MSILASRACRSLIIVIIIIVFIIWHFYIIPEREKSKEYIGEITQVSEKWKWYKKTQSFLVRRHSDFSYYWHIETEEGEELKIRLPHHIWTKGEEGMMIKKERGNRYPDIYN